ncbi:MAG: helix-turn-helix domain-containing protein [Lachnospiraceae bacterium]
MRIALELFAQNGYLGTSMNDIAGQLGFTKAALYKHYASKQEILDKIVERMNKMDYERAEVYEMPETEPDGFAEAYLHTPIQKIRTYSLAQFDHWTKEPFSSNFRKMLTLEQYRDPKLAQLHHDYLAGGPLEYMAAIFRKLTDSDEDAMQLALEFDGQCIFYTVSTTVPRKKNRFLLCWRHILITLLPRLRLVTERRKEQHERWRRRKTLGFMPVVRCQDALTDTAGDGIVTFPVLPPREKINAKNFTLKPTARR